jgi:hypothetical protein
MGQVHVKAVHAWVVHFSLLGRITPNKSFNPDWPDGQPVNSAVRTLDLADSVRKGNESFPDALHVIRLVQRDLGNSAVISALRSVSLLLLYDYFSESIPANFNA